jgi:hypothetical protein
MNSASFMRVLLVLTACLPVNQPSVTGSERKADQAEQFLGSIGVCSAVSRRGEKLENTIDAARYLGLRWLRVGYESGIPIADLIELHKQTGVRFSYGLEWGHKPCPAS